MVLIRKLGWRFPNFKTGLWFVIFLEWISSRPLLGPQASTYWVMSAWQPTLTNSIFWIKVVSRNGSINIMLHNISKISPKSPPVIGFYPCLSMLYCFFLIEPIKGYIIEGLGPCNNRWLDFGQSSSDYEPDGCKICRRSFVIFCYPWTFPLVSIVIFEV